MRRFLAILLSAALLAGLLLPSPALASKKEDDGSSLWPKGPKVQAESAVLMDLSSGAVLYKKHANRSQYPASITKIMTTLLAIENCSMGEIVTFSHEAVFGIEPGSTHIGIDEGEKLTVEQSLYAIMLASANEVASGMGEHIAGSIPDFADMMNARAKELGCKNTHFVNANGLHDDKHYTTAYDMALIARAAMTYGTFRKIIATKSYAIPPTNRHDNPNAFVNHHQMLTGNTHPQYKYEYCIGGKTGYTTKAGSTLVTFAQKDGMELVCVVMRDNGPDSAKNEYTDTIDLFNWAFENFTQYDLSSSVKEMQDSDVTLFTKYCPIFDTENPPFYLSSTTVLLPNGVDLDEAERTIEIYGEEEKDSASAKDEASNGADGEEAEDSERNGTESDGKASESNDADGEETVIGSVSYTYGGKVVGNADIYFRNQKFKNLATMEPAREVSTDSVRPIERYNLKPIIIGVIFLLIAAALLAYFYFTRIRHRRDDDWLRFR